MQNDCMCQTVFPSCETISNYFFTDLLVLLRRNEIDGELEAEDDNRMYYEAQVNEIMSNWSNEDEEKFVDERNDDSFLAELKSTDTIQQEHSIPLTCGVCGKIFSYPSNLERHIRLLYSANEKVSTSCPQCRKCFTSTDNLRRHESLTLNATSIVRKLSILLLVFPYAPTFLTLINPAVLLLLVTLVTL